MVAQPYFTPKLDETLAQLQYMDDLKATQGNNENPNYFKNLYSSISFTLKKPTSIL
jgi:hypothetical protein